MKKKIFFAVTNDLFYDQRMQKICSSMAAAGYDVTLVGRQLADSPMLKEMPYRQVRIPLRFKKGKLFYAEYNLKLYRYLKHEKPDAVCAIDLDTIVPVYLISKKMGIPRMYDAHEFFTEMIEVKRRPHIHFLWKMVEKYLVPRFPFGYTVAQQMVLDFKALYGVDYALVRNMPVFREPIDPTVTVPATVETILNSFNSQTDSRLPVILYQGAINEGRALHSLIDSMKRVNARLLLAGSGNLESEIRRYIQKTRSEDRIYMCGPVSPSDLRFLTAACFAGITIFDAYSKNQYYSLGNKFFDYIMAHKPQVCVEYPEYQAILKQFPVAVPLVNTKPESIASSLNKLLSDPVLYDNLQNICKDASKVLNWESEEITLLGCWKKLFAIDWED